MATDTENPKTLEANPKKTLDAPDPPTGPFLPAATSIPEESQNGSSLLPSTNGDQKEGKESKSRDSEGAEAPAVASPVGSCDAPVSNMQKKIRRAERFGMPVQLSEEEKRSSRAERFGTASTMHGSDALKKSEDQKRKARAERFGLPAKPTADEELKKKARLARFAQASKTDSVEEDKRKARAARFSVPTTSPVPQVNVKGDVEPAAVLGKASGGV